jgi:hypothetical protein
MDWKNLSYLGRISSGTPNWRSLRNEIINYRKNTCRYCGGSYYKYMMCFHLDSDPKNINKNNMDLACKMCYITTHLNFGHLNDVIVCYSNLTQTKIIKNTIDYVIKYDHVPKPNYLDPDIEIAPISLMELCSILIENKNELPIELSKYKIFFTNDLDIQFTNYYLNEKNNNININGSYMFTEDDDDDIKDDLIEDFDDKQLVLHISNKEEIDCLDKMYDKNNFKFTNQKMKENLKYVLKIKRVTAIQFESYPIYKLL